MDKGPLALGVGGWLLVGGPGSLQITGAKRAQQANGSWLIAGRAPGMRIAQGRLGSAQLRSRALPYAVSEGGGCAYCLLTGSKCRSH